MNTVMTMMVYDVQLYTVPSASIHQFINCQVATLLVVNFDSRRLSAFIRRLQTRYSSNATCSCHTTVALLAFCIRQASRRFMVR